jgi:protein-tyrosine-phosphatase
MRQVRNPLFRQDQWSSVHRRGLLMWGLLFLPGVIPGEARAACAPRKVLFVCPAGTVKSAIAREALKQRAASRGVAVTVRSRGLNIEDHVSPMLADRLRADGLDPRSEPIMALGGGDADWADIVIAFDEAASAPSLSKARAWTTPSWNADYDRAKADLDARLDALLTELARSACTHSSTSHP